MTWVIVLIMVIDAIVFMAIGFTVGFFSYRDVDIRITNKKVKNKTTTKGE